MNNFWKFGLAFLGGAVVGALVYKNSKEIRDICTKALGGVMDLKDKAMEAAEKLKADGIAAQVLNVSTLKPLIEDEVLKYTRGKKAVITAEEAVKTGGLGQAVASLLLGRVNIAFEQVAINDEFGTSAGNYEELLVRYGLSAIDIIKAVKKALGK